MGQALASESLTIAWEVVVRLRSRRTHASSLRQHRGLEIQIQRNSNELRVLVRCPLVEQPVRVEVRSDNVVVESGSKNNIVSHLRRLAVAVGALLGSLRLRSLLGRTFE